MRVKKVNYLEDYKLKITFSNHKTKIVDFWPLIKDSKSVYFVPLKDIEYFKKVSVDQDFITVVWPNEADFDPNLLYEIGTDVEKDNMPAKVASGPIRKKKKGTAVRYKSIASAKRISQPKKRN